VDQQFGVVPLEHDDAIDIRHAPCPVRRSVGWPAPATVADAT
jgi:hypothetical protein